jgi:hypothetical protein
MEKVPGILETVLKTNSIFLKRELKFKCLIYKEDRALPSLLPFLFSLLPLLPFWLSHFLPSTLNAMKISCYRLFKHWELLGLVEEAAQRNQLLPWAYNTSLCTFSNLRHN